MVVGIVSEVTAFFRSPISLNQHKVHTRLKNDCVKAMELSFCCQIFSRTVGLFYTKSRRPYRIGQPGQCDLYGWISFMPQHVPFHVEIEIKSGIGALSEDQKAWRKKCLDDKVIYVLAKNPKQCVEDTRAAAERAMIQFYGQQ